MHLSPLWAGRVPSFKKKPLESSSPKDSLCQIWLKMEQLFWRTFLKVLNVFLIFPNYLPFEKGVALHLTKLESPSPKKALSQFWTSGSAEEDFLKFSIYFYYFPIICPLRKAWPFIWTILNPLHPRMLCAKFGWN